MVDVNDVIDRQDRRPRSLAGMVIDDRAAVVAKVREKQLRFGAAWEDAFRLLALHDDEEEES
jgi:hypothetical protein